MTNFPLNTIVRNFNTTAKVVGYHHDGSLILQGYGLRDSGAGRWIADPELCEQLDLPAENLIHKDCLARE